MGFGATRAVDGVDLDLKAGEIHGLIGENGAGKSTLMRVLGGFFDDYDGAISIAGRPVDLASPAAARREGVALVHQELSLLPEFTVAENIFLGREPFGRLPGMVSFSRMRQEAAKALSNCGVNVDPAAKVDDLSMAERQLVEIVKGVAFAPRVLILDEPTSSLTIREVRELFAIVRRLAVRGTAVVYISHKLDEVFAITDRITVMRDGRKVASAPTSDWTEPALVRAMVGRDLSSLFPHVPATPAHCGSRSAILFATAPSGRSPSRFAPAKSSASTASLALGAPNSQRPCSVSLQSTEVRFSWTGGRQRSGQPRRPSRRVSRSSPRTGVGWASCRCSQSPRTCR